MNKRNLFVVPAAMLLALSSCQDYDGRRADGEQDFSISVGIPGSLSTYAGATAFSHQGGASNVKSDKFDLRYTLEVYDGDKLAFRDTRIVKDNFTTQPVEFSARLLAKKYDFVLWADFVSEGSTEDLYYNTADLTGISYTANATAQTLTLDEADAYYKTVEVDLTTAGQNVSEIKLQRPFGKIRLIATDELSNPAGQSERPAAVSIDFKDAVVPSGFNARTGQPGEADKTVGTVTFNAVQEDALVAEKVIEGAYLLGNVYFFAAEPEAAYEMNVTVNSDAGNIGYRELSGIPVRENMLTTVIGNFYTNEGSLNVIVEDKFDDPEEVIELPDEVSAGSIEELKTLLADENIEVINLTGNITVNETLTASHPVTVKGNAEITTSGSSAVFNITSDGVVIEGLRFVKSDNSDQEIIKLTASGATITGCTFEGKYTDGSNETSRAILPNAGVAVTVENNRFINLRQPGYFQGDGTIIRNNYVEGTRGFVICCENKITLEGNSFSENAVDIAIIPSGTPYQAEYYDNVRLLSEKNNGAFVENQYTKASAIGNGNAEALVAALKNAEKIELLSGTYEMAEGISIASNQSVSGPENGRDNTIINIAEQSGDTWGVRLSGKLTDVSVIYNSNRTAGSAWTTNPGGVLFQKGGVLENCLVSKFRNGLYANNIDGITIKNNVIDANRTGIQFANSVGATVDGNTFSNNETMGVLLQNLTADSGYKPVFTNNTFEGNWYSDFENRWATTYIIELTGNTFSQEPATIKVQATTGEPGSSVTFTKPAEQVANIVTAIGENIVY